MDNPMEGWPIPRPFDVTANLEKPEPEHYEPRHPGRPSVGILPGRIACCKHNPCPDRPRWLVGRFKNKTWICPQCRSAWRTYWTNAADQGFWSWERLGRFEEEAL